MSSTDDSTTPADPAALRATVEAYVAAMSAGDKQAWLALFAPEATVEDPVGTPIHRGAEAIGAFWDLVQSMADTLRLELTGLVRVAGGEAAFPMQAHSTLGDMHLVVDIIDVFAFDAQARITAMRAFWDPAEMRTVS